MCLYVLMSSVYVSLSLSLFDCYGVRHNNVFTSSLFRFYFYFFFFFFLVVSHCSLCSFMSLSRSLSLALCLALCLSCCRFPIETLYCYFMKKNNNYKKNKNRMQTYKMHLFVCGQSDFISIVLSLSLCKLHIILAFYTLYAIHIGLEYNAIVSDSHFLLVFFFYFFAYKQDVYTRCCCCSLSPSLSLSLCVCVM
jgi:hypothetical protein